MLYVHYNPFYLFHVVSGHGMADPAVKCTLLAIFIRAIPFLLLLSINSLLRSNSAQLQRCSAYRTKAPVAHCCIKCLCCSCNEPQCSLGSQTACTQCTCSTLPGVIVPGTGSYPSNTASPNRLRFTVQQKKQHSGTETVQVFIKTEEDDEKELPPSLSLLFFFLTSRFIVVISGNRYLGCHHCTEFLRCLAETFERTQLSSSCVQNSVKTLVTCRAI